MTQNMALKGPHTKAQGAALGKRVENTQALKERDMDWNELWRPFRASTFITHRSPRAAPSVLPTSFSQRFCAAETEQQGVESAPDRLPARFAVTFAAEEAAEAGESAKELSRRFEGQAFF